VFGFDVADVLEILKLQGWKTASVVMMPTHYGDTEGNPEGD
jgi:hypothetical protein